jgi:hypothetical protein
MKLINRTEHPTSNTGAREQLFMNKADVGWSDRKSDARHAGKVNF